MNIDYRYRFVVDFSGREFSEIIRALQKHGNGKLAQELLDKRRTAANRLFRMLCETGVTDAEDLLIETDKNER